jgi:RimJ/RimL family protein N-acetyltransferase
MSYTIFPSVFPILEGPTIRLRQARTTDVNALHSMMQDELVIREYLPISVAPTVEQVRMGCVFQGIENYKNKTSITWVVELKSTGEVVGLRDVFVDDAFKPITVQGFVGARYRRRGISNEAYSLIINFAKKYGVSGILANTSIENYPALSLLFGVGFETNGVVFHNNELRVVAIHHLVDEPRPTPSSEAIKRIVTFAFMCLQAQTIDIKSNGSIQFEGQTRPLYKINIVAKNTFEHLPPRVTYSDMGFLSDGVIVASQNGHSDISYIDGRIPFSNPWKYCWKSCLL